MYVGKRERERESETESVCVYESPVFVKEVLERTKLAALVVCD